MREKLLETAKRSGVVDAESLEKFFERHTGDSRAMDEALMDAGIFTEDQVLKLFADTLGVPFYGQLRDVDVPVEFLSKVSATFAQHHSLLALKKNGSSMTVATSRPLGLYALDNVGKMMGVSVKPAFASRAVLSTAISAAYQQRVTILEDVADEVDAQNIEGLVQEVVNSEDLLDVVNRPPVIRLVNDVLFRACQMRASDVHIHPYEQKVLIRYRIDGIMYDMLTLDARILPVLVSRVKVMAGMDIAERRLPQDGRCSVRMAQREVDLRVSTVPTAYGERTVLRLLDKTTGLYDLGALGLNSGDIDRVDGLLKRTHGVFFVTGPTGSGKTTTLYGFLQRINSAEKNIITIEDPIEYQLSGISQIEVSSKKGMTFVRALRHVLRQDPDVIMVGEVRDEETARMVIQSSLTGHLVFSTLHTNDASGAVTRMLDLGVEPYLVASSVVAVLAQRLVRKLCTDCRECVAADSEQMRELGLGYSAFEKIYQSKGCEKCFQTGYLSRTGIYELMVIDDDIRQCIYQRKSAGVIKKAAIEAGMTSLRMDGLSKVESGDTSLAEVLRVAQGDDV